MKERLSAGEPIVKYSVDEDALATSLQVASISTMISINGLPYSTLPSVASVIDAHFPGSMGHLNLSWNFVPKCRESLLRATVRMQARATSDFFRAFDVVTPECGEPVLIHNIGLTDPSTPIGPGRSLADFF